MGFFSSLNQRYDIIICVFLFELFCQVSDVAHGPLVFIVAVVSLWPNLLRTLCLLPLWFTRRNFKSTRNKKAAFVWIIHTCNFIDIDSIM